MRNIFFLHAHEAYAVAEIQIKIYSVVEWSEREIGKEVSM